MMLSSYHHSDSDSISTITFESSRCLESKQFGRLNGIPEQRLVNTSSRNCYSNVLKEKDHEIMSLRNTLERLSDAHEAEIFDMKKVHANALQDMKNVHANALQDMEEIHANALQEKDKEILEMQEVHEVKMLDMLKLKLSNTSTSTSFSCHCKGKSSSSPTQGNGNNYSASFQREVSVSKASEDEVNAKQRSKMSWCNVKSEVSFCGRSMLSKIKIKASRRSIPKEIDVLNTSEVENLSKMTY